MNGFRLYDERWPLYLMYKNKIYSFMDSTIYRLISGNIEPVVRESYWTDNDYLRGASNFKTIPTKLVWLMHGDDIFKKFEEYKSLKEAVNGRKD